ncbi:hypothetical protein D5F01_LYC08203 [Larimichthys crocea]|uniref:Uncharacterized protein n=1 Tax=Larimichthys crocea TaxID=215358 RepID=A0A6G0HED7_LARCR|nr:hypothetical protein D5F01_LYC24450 [Larimichthys crocea]KAE8293105.1 hypothetical protein D5F01_LYC08203 [Larimichthys crocea]
MTDQIFSIAPPGNFSFEEPSSWPQWIRRFERFRLASGLNRKDEDYQVNSLLYVMGDKSDDILSTLPLTDQQKTAYAELNLIQQVASVQEEKQDMSHRYRAMFPKVFSGLGKLQGSYKIKLKEGAVPHALSDPRRVPLPMKEQVKEELDRMEALGVIRKIEQPTEWCAGMVVVPKPNKKPRICGPHPT